MFCFDCRRLNLLLAVLVAAASSPAQSSRPGWGSTPYHDASGTGVTFRVWAPDATSAFVRGEFNGWSGTATPLGKDLTNGVWSGNWSADVTSATNGQQYKYYFNFSGGSNFISGTNVWRHDPRARKVVNSGTGTGDNDYIYDPAAFNWTNDSPVSLALNDLVIYELHIGTFYNPNSGSGLQGTFLNATNRLDYLRNLGVSAVEILPVAEFPGTASWGYNPADIFAADNNSYGGPDGLKTFVKACHARGLAVFLDVIHNHYGPTDLDMWDFDGWSGTNPLGGGGIYFYESNTNLQFTPWGNTRPNFSSNQVCSFIQDNFTMWLSECHADGFRWDTPGTMMFANDGAYIPAAGNLISAINAMIHTNYTGKTSIAEDVYNSYGFDSAWDTSYPYAVTPILTNAVDANRNLNTLTNALAHNVRYGGSAGFGRVGFLESHDVVGDLNNGTRLVTAIDPVTPNSYRARKLSLLGAALTFTAPGVPMIFQGQEMLENQQFSTSRPVDWTKTNTYSAIVKCYRDMIGLRRNADGGVIGLKGDQISFLKLDTGNQLLGYRRWQSGSPTQDVVVVANLAGTTRASYPLPFPRAGTWYVHFNGDSTNYSSDFSNIGTSVVTASGTSPSATLAIGPYSVLVFSQTPLMPTLSFGVTNNVKTISWPANYSAWILQSATNIGPAAWPAVSSSQYQTNGSIISLNVTVTNRNTFYRLYKN
jgi:1,4-alpha-glucan branching enzyme